MVAQRQPQRQPQYMSVNEWRKLEQSSPDAKHEYIDGQVYLMAGGSLAHSRIGINICALLANKLSSPCSVYNSDAAVRLSPTRYVYPDASVSCDPQDQPTTEQMQVQVPSVVMEVLSDSTDGKDRIKKANYYYACPSIQEYMLIATRYQAVEVLRPADNGWTLHIFGPGQEIELLSIGVHLPLAALYKGTTVPELANDD